MSRLKWHADSRTFHEGVDRGVLYPRDSSPVAWNGLLSVNETPSEGGGTTAYYDGQKYIQRSGAESYAASIEAFTYPEVLDTEDEFDFAYRVNIDDWYELHLVYNAAFFASESEFVSMDQETEAVVFKWDLTTTPEILENMRPCSRIIISSKYASPEAIAEVERYLYGDDTTIPRQMHLPELVTIFENQPAFTIVDNGDGTFTATGSIAYIDQIDSTTFEFNTPTVLLINTDTYNISSW